MSCHAELHGSEVPRGWQLTEVPGNLTVASSFQLCRLQGEDVWKFQFVRSGM